MSAVNEWGIPQHLRLAPTPPTGWRTLVLCKGKGKTGEGCNMPQQGTTCYCRWHQDQAPKEEEHGNCTSQKSRV